MLFWASTFYVTHLSISLKEADSAYEEFFMIDLESGIITISLKKMYIEVIK